MQSECHFEDFGNLLDAVHSMGDHIFSERKPRMKLPNQIVTATIALWVLAGVFFGLWQESIWAGLFMSSTLVLISRKI